MSLQLPRVVAYPRVGENTKEVDPEGLQRMVAQLTLLLQNFQSRIQILEASVRVETDIARPPSRIGAVAVTSIGDVYIAVGLTPADWVLVS